MYPMMMYKMKNRAKVKVKVIVIVLIKMLNNLILYYRWLKLSIIACRIIKLLQTYWKIKNNKVIKMTPHGNHIIKIKKLIFNSIIGSSKKQLKLHKQVHYYHSVHPLKNPQSLKNMKHYNLRNITPHRQPQILNNHYRISHYTPLQPAHPLPHP